MTRRALVFPGQGTQFVGMGVALRAEFPQTEPLFALADELLGVPLSQLMAEGPAEQLMLTEHTQPAVLVYSLALLQVLQEHGVEPDAVAGYSLGEYSALVAAGALEPRHAIGLVQRRAEAMLAAHPHNPESMAVVVGPPRAELEHLLGDCPADELVCVAGYCTPSLHSLSGSPGGLDWLDQALRSRGGGQTRPVPVTLPFHSPLLEGARAAFRADLAQAPLRAPSCPLVPNATATPERDPERLREALDRQLVAPVRWVETLAALRSLDIEEVWEVGPGKSLTTYLRKTDRRMGRVTVNDPASLRAALERLRA